jgi:hypothetical protein
MYDFSAKAFLASAKAAADEADKNKAKAATVKKRPAKKEGK